MPEGDPPVPRPSTTTAQPTKRKGRGGNAHVRAMEKAIKAHNSEPNPEPPEPHAKAPVVPQSLQPVEELPWYEGTLFWGAVSAVIALISIYLAAALKDIRWFLFLAWPFCILALVSCARTVRSPKNKHLIRGLMIIFGSAVCGLGLWYLSRLIPPAPNTEDLPQQIKVLGENVANLKNLLLGRQTWQSPSPPVADPSREGKIEFIQMVSETNKNSVPPVTSWLFQFKVVDGPVSHIKIPALGYQIAPRIKVPGITGKFYRAFERKIAMEKNMEEITGAMEPGEGLQIPPSPMTEVNNSLNIWTETFIFAHGEWKNQAGAIQKTDVCFFADTQSPWLGANTAWQPCRVSAPTAIELKLESMPPKQLLRVASKLSILIANNDAEYSRQLALVKQKFPISDTDSPDAQVKEQDAQTKAITSMQNELWQKFGTGECPELSPLIEEMLFRISYSEKDWLAFYQKSNPDAFPGTSPEQLQSQADGVLEDTILGCDKFGPFVFQQAPTLGKGLTILATAFKESADYYVASPFESRPLR